MEIIVRATVIFFFVWLVTRSIGKRQLAELSAFQLILLVTIGDLVQQGVTQADESVTGALTVIATFSALTVLVGYISFKVRRVRLALEGEPIVLVEDGRPVERNLRRERLTVEEIEAEARLQQIPSLDDVQWAVLETGGQISCIPKKG